MFLFSFGSEFWINFYCLIDTVDTELLTMAWDNLIKLTRRFTIPSDCTSAERCSLAFLTDLQASTWFLRSKSMADILTPVAAKLRTVLATPVNHVESNYEFDHSFMTQCLDNPRRKVGLINCIF